MRVIAQGVHVISFLCTLIRYHVNICVFGPVHTVGRERRVRLVGQGNHRYRFLLGDHSVEIDTNDLLDLDQSLPSRSIKGPFVA